MIKQQTKILMLTAALLWLLAACTAAPTAAPTAATEPAGEEAHAELPDVAANDQGYIDLSVEQLAAAMADKHFTLVNVHIPDQGSLPETDYAIPYNDLDAFTSALTDKDASIVLYCRSGGMSSQIAPALVDMDYTNLYELNGGFNAWAAAGNELVPAQ